MKLHLEKKGIRVLGVAESFRPSNRKRSLLAGVVMRSDLIVDGFVFGSCTLGGDDSTKSILRMYRMLRRNDINAMMLNGAVISNYNIVDVDEIARRTGIPVLALTFEESEGLEEHIRHHFPDTYESKLQAYRGLGGRSKIILRTGFEIFLRVSGAPLMEARRLIDRFTLQGAIPEPIRLSRLVARARSGMI